MDEELRRLLESMEQKTAAQFEAMQQRNDAAHTETRRHFGVVAERLETKIELVAEGVVAANERIDRLDAKVDQLADHITNEFSDVRSLITLSHTQLDRRVRTLEER